MIMAISQKEYKKKIDALPSLEETKKVILKNNSVMPTRIKVGGRHYLDSNHWIDRADVNEYNREDVSEYVGTYYNLVGGKISVGSKTLKDMIRLVVGGNEEMISLGRVR